MHEWVGEWVCVCVCERVDLARDLKKKEKIAEQASRHKENKGATSQQGLTRRGEKATKKIKGRGVPASKAQ